MINSMIGQRIPLSKLDIIEQAPSPLKRKAKIFAQKLPQDFFMLRRTPLQSERSCPNSDRNHIQTHNQSRKVGQAERISAAREVGLRKGEFSARIIQDQSKAVDLFMGIISSTRQIRKSIRKHSLELRKDTKLSNNIQNIRIELPPLFLKKGVTANF